jgi:tRNA(fMet)-specific endonuclease VapC
MRYLLDAGSVVDLLHGSISKLAWRLRREKPVDVALPAIVAQELYCGAFRSQRAEQNVALVDALEFPVLEFDKEDARHAGEIRALAAAKGFALGPYDILVAGQARSRKLTLITHNMNGFARVPGLRCEDWLR